MSNNDRTSMTESSSLTMYASERPPGKTFIGCAECSSVVDIVEASSDDDLVREIIGKKVEGRAKGTYACPAGHDGKLKVL